MCVYVVRLTIKGGRLVVCLKGENWMLALSDKKMRGKSESEFGWLSGGRSGVNRRAKEKEVALLVSPEVQNGVKEWREVSS